MWAAAAPGMDNIEGRVVAQAGFGRPLERAFDHRAVPETVLRSELDLRQFALTYRAERSEPSGRILTADEAVDHRAGLAAEPPCLLKPAP